MPIYTYKCKKCGEVFDRFEKMSSNGSGKCDLCNSEAVRVFSPAGIIFKGSGFYTTDYKSGSNKANIAPAKPETSEKGAGKKEEAAAGSSSAAKQGETGSAEKGSQSSGNQPENSRNSRQNQSTGKDAKSG
jgi:putative FmdB family regulatory protein